MHFLKTLIVVLLSFSFSFADGLPTQKSVEEFFSLGLQNYQNGKFTEASQQFESALQIEPENASLLYNLGLSEYRVGKTGLAIALWRKALTSDPSLIEAKAAIDFAFSRLTVKELPHQVMLLERVRTKVLSFISIHQLLFLLVITCFSCGWMLLNYLGSRKSALANLMPVPTPTFKLFLTGFLFLITTSLTFLKAWDYSVPRATVLPSKIEVRTGPNPTHAPLFEIYEGLEVIIRDSQNDWLKIQYPGGRMGWLPRESLFQTWGKKI